MNRGQIISGVMALLIAVLPAVQALGGEAAAQARLSLTLLEAEQLALVNSHALESLRLVKESTSESAAGQGAKRFPHLGLEGTARFNSDIGMVQLPTGQQMQIGDHHSWSVGPVLEWVAFDAGQLSRQTDSLRRLADSQGYQYSSARRQKLLASRLAYFGVQLALKQLRLVSDSLGVAVAQHRDVEQNHQAGLASRLDLVTAHQEVVDRTRDFQDAQAELAVRVRELAAITGQQQEQQTIFPVGSGMGGRGGSGRADLIVDVEPIDRTLAAFLPRTDAMAPVEEHPLVSAAEQQRESAIAAERGVKAGRWPKVSVLGRSSFEYPNFAELNTIQQNALSFGLKMPIFDWGLISHQARSQRHQASAAEEQRQQLIVDLNRDLGQARDRIAALKAQRATCAAAVRDAAESSALIYEAYKAGQLTFLEVQRANFRSLAARVEAARTDVQLLAQIARLSEIVSSEGE